MSACGGSDPSLGAEDASATCAVVWDSRVCSGVVDPVALAPGIDGVPVGELGETDGLHFHCRPENAESHNGKLAIHFVGTGADPLTKHDFSLRACSLGFAALAPMYENSQGVRDLCQNDSTCYEAVRKEIIYGIDESPLVEVSSASSLLNRTETLLTHLAATDSSFPAWARLASEFSQGAWDALTLSGHSQGSGHALLLARDHAVERVVMLAGVPDSLSVDRATAPAAWILEFQSASPKTASSRFYGYNHQDDGLAGYSAVIANYETLGMDPIACAAGGPDISTYPSACRRLYVPASGCGDFEAHRVVAVDTFGTAEAPCSIPGNDHSNAYPWQFLLTNP